MGTGASCKQRTPLASTPDVRHADRANQRMVVLNDCLMLLVEVTLVEPPENPCPGANETVL